MRESERLIGNQKRSCFGPGRWASRAGAIGDESRVEARGGTCRGER